MGADDIAQIYHKTGGSTKFIFVLSMLSFTLQYAVANHLSEQKHIVYFTTQFMKVGLDS